MAIVQLKHPIRGPRGEIKQIVLREPKFRDLMSCGLPSMWVVLPNGGGFEQENMTEVEEWICRLADI